MIFTQDTADTDRRNTDRRNVAGRSVNRQIAELGATVRRLQFLSSTDLGHPGPAANSPDRHDAGWRPASLTAVRAKDQNSPGTRG